MNNVVYLIGRLKEGREEIGEEVVFQLEAYDDLSKDSREPFNIDVIVSNTIYKHIVEYCKENDLLGCRGKIIRRNDKMYVYCDKVSFLASAGKVEQQDEDSNEEDN